MAVDPKRPVPRSGMGGLVHPAARRRRPGTRAVSDLGRHHHHGGGGPGARRAGGLPTHPRRTCRSRAREGHRSAGPGAGPRHQARGSPGDPGAAASDVRGHQGAQGLEARRRRRQRALLAALVRDRRPAWRRQDHGAAPLGPELPVPRPHRQRRQGRRRHAQLRVVVHQRGHPARHRGPLHHRGRPTTTSGWRSSTRSRRTGRPSRSTAWWWRWRSAS